MNYSLVNRKFREAITLLYEAEQLIEEHTANREACDWYFSSASASRLQEAIGALRALWNDRIE